MRTKMGGLRTAARRSPNSNARGPEILHSTRPKWAVPRGEGPRRRKRCRERRVRRLGESRRPSRLKGRLSAAPGRTGASSEGVARVVARRGTLTMAATSCSSIPDCSRHRFRVTRATRRARWSSMKVRSSARAAVGALLAAAVLRRGRRRQLDSVMRVQTPRECARCGRAGSTMSRDDRRRAPVAAFRAVAA